MYRFLILPVVATLQIVFAGLLISIFPLSDAHCCSIPEFHIMYDDWRNISKAKNAFANYSNQVVTEEIGEGRVKKELKSITYDGRIYYDSFDVTADYPGLYKKLSAFINASAGEVEVHLNDKRVIVGEQYVIEELAALLANSSSSLYLISKPVSKSGGGGEFSWHVFKACLDGESDRFFALCFKGLSSDAAGSKESNNQEGITEPDDAGPSEVSLS